MTMVVLVMLKLCKSSPKVRRAEERQSLKEVLSSAQGPIREIHFLWGIIFSVRNIVSVLLKEDTFVLPSGGGRDIIIMFLQPIDDFFGRLLIRLSALRIKVGQYIVQAYNTDLCTIRKAQHAPTNCWQFRIISSCYSYYFKG